MLPYLHISSTNQLPNCNIARILEFIANEVRLETYFDETSKREQFLCWEECAGRGLINIKPFLLVYPTFVSRSI